MEAQAAIDRRPTSNRGHHGDGPSSIEARLSDLVEAIGGCRDQAAFTELFGQLAPRVKRLLVRRGASFAMADDLTQETMLSVWRHAATFDRRRASVSTWVLTIARNKQIDLVRGQRRLNDAGWELLEPESPASEPDCERILLARQSTEILHHAIGRLPRTQELVVRQAFWEARSHREIAAEQALPLGTVKSRIRLALAQLRTSLSEAELR
jgi:RNA polymerase sigma-70 factor (ECF subfamily)